MSDDLTPRQVADELGVTVRTVQRWIADGRLPASRVGSRVRVSRSSLAAVSAGPAAVPATRAIRTLLVANRGEIAVRVTRTARAMGMRVIGIHAPDERAPDGVDEAHELRSYLDAEAIISIARRSGADAVHPGYGFLAENAAFARAVIEAGLTWVGPPPEAIAAMGDKAAARRRAASHGVPTLPGYDGDAQDEGTLVAEAERIGFPLLVKPSAGGGGKGMRVVRDAGELPEALGGARREAHRSFGDDRLILERYLEGARHVEVQVLFDSYGNGVHLGERDCSTQRRSQKIVEEAPAPSVTPELRARMGRAAVEVAGAVGYASAGTVEMLLTDAGEFSFLEMNTRLQVEHPVTEAVTGRDLVADQLRIAAGASLSELGLDEPPAIRGHAVEARVYAEDPEAGFLPASGHVHLLRWPPDIRIDTGLREHDPVSDRYDPLLAKLVAHGATRAEALDRLAEALARTTILGVRTNVRFLRWILGQPAMREGAMRTDTLAALELPGPPPLEERHWRSAAGMLAGEGHDPWEGGWRLNAAAVRRLRCGDQDRTVPLDSMPPSGVGGAAGDAPVAVEGGEAVFVDVDGQSLEFRQAPPPSVEDAVRHAAAAAGDGGASLVAPMPGRVVSVRAAAGAAVRAHQAIVVIEAMKMEHAVVAPADGTLASLHVAEGQQVERGDLIGEIVAGHTEGDG